MKTWKIEREIGNGYDDEGNLIEQDRWVVTDGITRMIFPLAQYRTKESAWEAWANRIM